MRDEETRAEKEGKNASERGKEDTTESQRDAKARDGEPGVSRVLLIRLRTN